MEVGVEFLRTVATIQIDRQDLQDRRALRLKRWEKIRAREDVVEVIVKHVKVVEDRCRLGEASGEGRRCLRHHRHELPFDRRTP